MAKPDWGAKHLCQDCGAKYYDLNRSPVICPKCGTEFKADTLLRSRRNRPAPAPKRPVPKAQVKSVEAADDGGDDGAVPGKDGDDPSEVAAAAPAGGPIEDVSELGEDDDDVAEVVTKGDDKEET